MTAKYRAIVDKVKFEKECQTELETAEKEVQTVEDLTLLTPRKSIDVPIQNFQQQSGKQEAPSEMKKLSSSEQEQQPSNSIRKSTHEDLVEMQKIRKHSMEVPELDNFLESPHFIERDQIKITTRRSQMMPVLKNKL